MAVYSATSHPQGVMKKVYPTVGHQVSVYRGAAISAATTVNHVN